jgi:hypothetical protein
VLRPYADVSSRDARAADVRVTLPNTKGRNGPLLGTMPRRTVTTWYPLAVQASHTFALPVPLDALVSFLADPLHIGVGLEKGCVLERSTHPATQQGSWAVVARGRTRTRVEYVVFHPPHEIAVSLIHSGPGSGGQSGTWRYATAADAGTDGCHLRVEIESPSRVTDPAARLLLPIMWWQLGRRLRAIESRGT